MPVNELPPGFTPILATVPRHLHAQSPAGTLGNCRRHDQRVQRHRDVRRHGTAGMLAAGISEALLTTAAGRASPYLPSSPISISSVASTVWSSKSTGWASRWSTPLPPMAGSNRRGRSPPERNRARPPDPTWPPRWGPPTVGETRPLKNRRSPVDKPSRTRQPTRTGTSARRPSPCR